MNNRLMIGAALSAMGFAAAQAADAPAPDVAGADAATAVESVVVTATRYAQPIDKVGQSITVIDHQTLEAQQTVIVSELLNRTAGVSVTRNGGPGGTTSLRVRGAETDQTVFVIDGVKLNDPSAAGGGYDSSSLLVGDIERIEVLRGAQSTLWGSQAIGGVVDIVTAQPTKPFEAQASAEGGSLSTSYLRAAAGGVTDRLSWRVAASRYHTDGVSAYEFGKERDGDTNTGLSGRANLRLAQDVSLDVRALYSRSRTAFDGFPPPAFVFADDREYGVSKDLVVYSGLNFGLLDGHLRNRVAFGYTRSERHDFNPDQAVTTRTFDSLGQNRRFEYQGVADLAKGWTATFGLEREVARMHSASPSDFDPTPTPVSGRSTINSAYGQLSGSVVKGLTLTVGVRHDHHDTFGGVTLGQVAAAWSLNGGATVLRASYGQGFKAPTLYQLFSEFGNTALKPERANSWDAGVEQAFLNGAAHVQATYFHRRTRNQIDFFSCFGSTGPLCPSHPSGGYYDNIARTKAQGVELTGDATLGPVTLQANYTWTKAKNDVRGSANFGRFLARRPEHQANLWADWTWLGKLTSGVGVEYVGASYDDPGNFNRIRGRTLFDVRASYPITEAVEVYGRVENLTDKHCETTRNYGELGRTAYAGVRAKF
jgi:vitamin B12 transporter